MTTYREWLFGRRRSVDLRAGSSWIAIRVCVLLASLALTACEEGGPSRDAAGDARADESDTDAAADADAAVDTDGPDASHLDMDADVDVDADPELDADVDPDLDADVAHLDADSADADAAEPQDGAESGTPETDAGPDDVACAPLLSGEVFIELGYTAGMSQIKTTNDRVLAQDAAGHWMLWNSNDWTLIAQGERPCVRDGLDCLSRRLEMAGDLIMFQDSSTIDLRASSDAHVIGSIPRGTTPGTGTASGLASDGSYVWTSTATALETWSRTGTPIASRPGNYAGVLTSTEFIQPGIWADPAQIKVARGPQGVDSIELVSPLTGASSQSSTFLGTFQSWFDDGSRFFTSSGTTIRVYSAAAAQQKIIALSSFNAALDAVFGYGDYFWLYHQTASSPSFNVYSVSGGSAPVWSSRSDRPPHLEQTGMGRTSFLPSSNGLLSVGRLVLDLRGTTIQQIAPSLPPSAVVFGSTPQGKLFAAYGAVVYGGNADGSRFSQLNCGAVRTVAPGPEGTWAIALARQTLIVDLQSRQVRRVLPISPFTMALSSDGATLLAKEDGSAPLVFYDVATGNVIRRLGLPTDGPDVGTFDVAKSAARIAVEFIHEGTPNSFEHVTTGLDGSAPDQIATTSESRSMSISPSGRRLALVESTGDDYPDYTGSTNIYEDGSLVGAAVGVVAGWLDESRLLVMVGSESSDVEPRVVDVQGAILSRPPLPNIRRFDSLAGGSLIDVDVDSTNRILDVATGNVVWTAPPYVSPSPYVYNGRANDAYVVYWSGPQLKFVAR